VIRIHPVRNEIVQRIVVRQRLSSVAIGENAVWVVVA
jgi:hypothetical protein